MSGKKRGIRQTVCKSVMFEAEPETEDFFHSSNPYNRRERPMCSEREREGKNCEHSTQAHRVVHLPSRMRG